MLFYSLPGAKTGFLRKYYLRRIFKLKLKRILATVLCIAMVLSTMSFTAFAEGTAVAKVGNTEYATIDEAIAAWTNGTTLTLLANVTLSDVIKLSSTEYHILDLGTYTMTAASNKDAIQYVVNGRSSAGYALDIKADATNPGGITATGKTIVSHIKPSSNAPGKDRPITRFYGGVFNASYVVKQGGSGLFLPGAGYTGASAPYFQFYGGVYNGTIYTNRSQNQFHGGTFNGSMQMSVDSSAYTLVAGGTFKNLSNSMGSALNSDKFTIGSAKGVYDKEVYINDNGNYVIAAAEPAEGIEAAVAKTPGSNDYLAYSKVETEGALNYTDVYTALEKNKTATVTVYTDELDLTDSSFNGTIVVPEGEEITIVVADGATPTWTVESAVESEEPNVTYKDENGNELVKDEDGSFAPVGPDVTIDGVDVVVTPVDGVPDSYEVILGADATWTDGTIATMTFPAVEGANDGDFTYVVHEHNDTNYIYVGKVEGDTVTVENTVGFSTFTVYAGGLEEALAAAQDGDTIELLTDVEIANNNAYAVVINKSITIDGNGHTISQADGYSNAWALLYFQGADDVTIKNLIFDNISGGAAIWAIDTDVVVEDCVFRNGEHTQIQGLIRMTSGDVTIKDTKFLDNNCSMAISFNFDVESSEESVDALEILNCEFEGNTCNDTALIYFVKGVSSEISGSTFTGNTVNTSSHGAIVYYSEGANGVVSGNEFKNNTITAASARAGVLALEAGTTAYNNAFISNSVSSTANGTTYVGTVLNKADADSEGITISGNYWGGEEPDYANVKGAPNTLDNYYTTYENGVLGGIEEITTSLSYEEFNELIRTAEGGVYDGEGISVVLKDSERSYQNNKTAQFFVGGTNVNITDPVDTVNVSNVNFIFEDDDTTNAYTSGELQVFAKNISFTNCTFEGVAVSPWGKSNSENAESAVFTECTWKNLSGRYGVHQNRASALTVTGCTFENCERGIHTNSTTVSSITITDNTFTGIGDGYGVLCLAENGDLSKATLDISGNIAEGQVMLRQLNATTTYAQVSDILDTTNNTYGTAYVSGSTEPKAPAVAKIGDIEYETLEAALKALTSGATLTLLDDVTISEDWDCRYNGAKITVPVTIDGNGKTIKLTGAVDDKNWNTVFRFEDVATVKNLTIDVSEATMVDRGISSKLSIVVENCNFIGNGTSAKRAVIFGEAAGAALSDVTATITNSSFTNWSYGVSDNQSAKDAKTVSITGSTFTNASVLVSASETVTFTDNKMSGGYVNISSYTADNTCKVTATDNVLDLNASMDNTINVGGEIEAQEGFMLPFDGVTINNLNDLKAFRDAVNSGVNYAGKTVTLNADIDLAGEDWTPIGTSTNPFTGTFDGQGHTISNVYVNFNGNAGLFGQVAEQTENVTGTVQNLTVHNATIIATGENCAGVIAVARLGARITNVKLTGEITIEGYRGVGGIVGNGFPTINNCSVEGEGSITATYWGAGGILGFASDKGAKAYNSTVTATENGLTIRGKLGGVGAVTGTPYGAATNGAVISGVQITSDNNYYMGYVDASGTVSGTVTVTDVTVKVSGEEIIGCDAVASIGDAIYFDFNTALKAALDGCTITLLSDIELKGTIFTDKSITIDGNNHKITPAAGFVADGHGAAISFGNDDDANDSFTIKNLTFDGFSGLTRVVRANFDTAAIENCVFENNNVSSGVITSAYAELNVKDCEFNNNTTDFAVVNIGFDVSAGTELVANLTGNTFTENNAAFAVVYLASSANVTDNYFSGNIHTGENANAAAILAGPYTGNMSYTININENAFVNAMSKGETALPAVFAEDWSSLGSNTDFDLSSNYWKGVKPAEGVDYKTSGSNPNVTLNDYYTTYEDGVLGGLETNASYVAQVGDNKYTSLEAAIAAAQDGDVVEILADIDLGSTTVTIPAGVAMTLDLNGKTVSGVCNAGQAHMIMVAYGADLTIMDSSAEQTGKLTYAQGTSNVGWIIDVEGELVLESGTLELTGSWSIGYAVDVRPNAWGTAYTEPTTFVMNGGKVVSSDGAVRVASSSSDTYKNISASFTMNGGEIEADWDGVFVQQSNAAWDVLNVTINNGTIKSGLNPIRFYGPAATSYVNGEECVDIELNGGTLTYTGTETREWVVDGILRIGGGVSVDDFLKDTAVTASENFAEANVTEGYEWVEADGKYTLQKAEPELIGFNRLSASLDSSLALNIYMNKADLPGEDYYAEIKHEKATGDVVTTRIPYADWVVSENEIAFRYTGIAAKEMTDIIKITVYNASDNTPKSITAETSLKKYAISMINLGLSNSDYRHWVPVIVDMLNYGAAAQTMFNYNLEDMANKDMDDFQQYASESYTLDTEGCSATGTAKEASLTLDGMIKLNIYFTNVTEGMYATYSYTTHAGTNISERVEYDSLISRTIGGVKCFAPSIGIAVADINTPVTVTMYNADDSVAGKVVYKAGAYLNYSINNSDDDIYPALAKFATSAKAAFEK